VQFRHTENPIRINGLQALHRKAPVISFREYGPRENEFTAFAAWVVFSPPCITLEYNEKKRPLPGLENSFSGAIGGGNATASEPSLEKTK
jgi:hypothetical protein